MLLSLAHALRASYCDGGSRYVM